MKNEMRKPTYSEAYMYKNLFWLCIAAFIFMTVMTELVIRVLYFYTVTDIAYQNAAQVIRIVREALVIISTYVGLGVLCVSVCNFGDNAKGVIRVAFISHAVYFVTYAASYYMFTADIAMSVFQAVTETFVNLAVMLIIWIVIRAYTKRKETYMSVDRYTPSAIAHGHVYTVCFIISASVFSGVQIVLTLVDMLGDFLDPAIGPPINLKETLYWVLEYTGIILYAALGFAIMVLVGLYAQHLKDSAKKIFKNT